MADSLAYKMGFWSASTITLLVMLIDAGMVASAVLYPMASISNITDYAASFSSYQMLPFIPSLILAPVFLVLIFSVYYALSGEKKLFGQLALAFSVPCITILSLHYYIQLTVVQQGLLSNQLEGLWQFAAPNPHSFFWKWLIPKFVFWF